MGNCFQSASEDSTPLPPPEEKVISRYISSFGFQRRAASDCISCILANSTGGKITESQLNTIITELNLTIVDLDTPDSKNFVFFKQFRDKRMYEAMKMCALALLLSAGKLKDKVGPMFDAIPNQSDGEVDTESLRTLWKTMVTVASEALPFLSIDENPIPGQSLSNEACRGYVGILEKAEDQLVKELVDGAMVGLGRIRKQEFVERVGNLPLFQVLAGPDRIRGVLYARATAKTKP